MKTVGLICLLTLTVGSGLAAPTAAQIIPDRTTGTRVRSNLNIRNIPSDLIQGGTVRQHNLFHSFQDFNIKTDRGAYFANPKGIQTIFSRVTGRKTSTINGTLGVLGPADLFLLNPNGIVFGPNAKLDLSGSFTASTANEFRFSDGLIFSAIKPQAAPLLTVNLAPGAQLGTQGQGDITNAGLLDVDQGRSLTLHGNLIEHMGVLKAPSGTINLFGQSVGLLNQARIDVSGPKVGGIVHIGGISQGQDPSFNAQRTFIGPQTQIKANALLPGNGGTVVVWSDELTGFYGNIEALGAGLQGSSETSRGGNIEVSSQGQLIFRGNVDTTTPFGASGTLLLDPTTITIANGNGESGDDGVDHFAGDRSGLPGQILSAPLSNIDDASPTTIFESELEGLSGKTDVILQATDGITIKDLADNELRFAQGTGRITLTADANQDGIGDVIMEDLQDSLTTQGRHFSISGENMHLGSINTQGYGNVIDGGNVSINAGRHISVNDIVTGTSHLADRKSGLIQVGQGGDIQLVSQGNIKTQDLRSDTFGRSDRTSIIGGKGGDISLFSASGLINTGKIVSSSQTQSVVGDITGADGGRISLKTTTGDIQVGQVSSQSRQFSETPTSQGKVVGGNGGEISIQTNSGNITTSSLTASSSSFPGLDAIAGNGGSVSLSTQTGNIVISGNLDTFALATGSAGIGGDILLSAEAGSIFGQNLTPPPDPDKTQIRTFSVSFNQSEGEVGDGIREGIGGDVILTAKDHISTVEILTLSSRVKAGNISVNGTGNLLINNVDLTPSGDFAIDDFFEDRLFDDSFELEFDGEEQVGAVTVTGKESLTFRRSSIDSTTLGQKDGGDITIKSPGLITFKQGSVLESNTLSSGAAGNIKLESDTGIILTNFGEIIAVSDGEGNAGNITLDAPRIVIKDNVFISTETILGNGGLISVISEDLRIFSGGEFFASTFGEGDAGSIKFDVSQTLLLDEGAIEASTSFESTGRGGAINVDASQITLRNSRISVNSEGQGLGGSIFVISDQLALDQQSSISAATASADGGNIQLQMSDLLTLDDASQITATAGIARGDGNGGNIEIDANFILALPDGQTQILAEAFEGRGGNINIATNAIFGDRFLDISASSNLGVDGQVNIETPGIDPSKSLNQLPSTVVDSSTRIADACAVNHQGQSQFVVTGRGGLPLMPRRRPTGIHLSADLGEFHLLNSNLARRGSQPMKLASRGSRLKIPLDLQQQLRAGNNAYQNAKYAQAVGHWTQAVQTLAQGRDPVIYASMLSNLALGYHHLGDWHKAELALSTSQKILTPKLQVQYPHLYAQALNTQASLSLAKGEIQSALQDWQRATQLYTQVDHPSGQIRSQLNQTQALRSLGFYRQAQTKLIPLIQEFAAQPPSAEKAAALLQFGELLRASGDVVEAQTTLEHAIVVAQSLQLPALSSTILLNLGHTAQAQSKTDQALTYYQQAFAVAPTAIAQFQAQVSQLELLTPNNLPKAQSLGARLQRQSRSLTASREALYTQLHFVDIALQQNLIPAPQLMVILAQIEQQAQELDDPLLQAYGLGYRGRIDHALDNRSAALAATSQALKLARSQNAPEVVYQWAWQLGRYRIEQGDRDGAQAAYGEAIEALRSIRGDLAIASTDVQFTFRDGVEPLYRQYVKLLLDANTSDANLSKARALIEDLQLAEMNDYFQDACTQSTPIMADQVDPKAAVIYPIVLEDRVDVIVSIGKQQLRHYSTPIAQGQVEKTVNQLLRSLTTPIGSRQKHINQQLQQVYEWVVGPAAEALAQHEVETLVFVADGALRTLPLSALHDGHEYLIERYNVALSPGLDLLARPQKRKKLQMLIGGISEARPGFPALPFVPQEIERVAAQIPKHQRFLNQDLTQNKLTQQLINRPPDVIHLATHGEFGPNAKDTFVLTWDSKLSIEDMGAFLQSRRRSSAPVVDLLVLSACKTATGNSRAVLGIAGMTIRSGVRSTLAGLWTLNDQAAAVFMEQFYQALAQPQVTKAEALRQAQLALMQDPNFSSPYYWSPFVLVGNWL